LNTKWRNHLFVFWDASDHVLGLLGKLLRRRGALAWFHGIWTCGEEVLEY
jgi:hypothetical protein